MKKLELNRDANRVDDASIIREVRLPGRWLKAVLAVTVLIALAAASWQAYVLYFKPRQDQKKVEAALAAFGAARKQDKAFEALKALTKTTSADLRGSATNVSTIAYHTSKGAVVNFTRAIASEWGRHNINVNAICPGFFPSKMSAGLLEKVGEAVIARAPLHRIGGDEDLKGVVVFLASEASRHITGQSIAVDGGISAV